MRYKNIGFVLFPCILCVLWFNKCFWFFFVPFVVRKGFYGIKEGMLEKLLNFFLKNENKAIRYTSVTAVCVGITVLLAYFIRIAWGLRPAVDKAIDGANTGAEVFRGSGDMARKAIKDLKDFQSMELEQKEKKPDPLQAFNQNLGKGSGKAEKVALADESGKEKFEEMVPARRFTTVQREIKRGSYLLIENRKKGADRLFEEVQRRVPAFVKANYQNRAYEAIIKDAMEKELLSQTMLDDFLFNSAAELDRLLFDAVNAELEKQLRYLQLEKPEMTYEALKKSLPDARTICDSIYAKLNNQNLTAEQLSAAGRYFEEVERNRSSISKGAFVAVTGTVLTGLVAWGAVAVMPGIGVPALIGKGLAVLICGGGAVGTGYATWQAAVERDQKIREGEKRFENGLYDAIHKTQDEFKELLVNSLNHLIDEYSKPEFLAEFFKETLIELEESSAEVMRIEAVLKD